MGFFSFSWVSLNLILLTEVEFYCKNYANVRFKLTFIQALALVTMRSTYIGQPVRASAAPLILHMRACLGGLTYA